MHPTSALRRAAGVGTIALVAAVGLAACSNGGATPEASASFDTSEPVTITFMEAMSSGALKDSLAAATDRFMAENPNITVELAEQPDYGTLRTKIDAQVAAGDAPTIAQVYSSWAVELAASEVIVPLDERVAASDEYASFYKGIQDDMKLEDGVNWMWPFNKSVYVQYTNTTMVPEAPRTWDEFSTVAKDVSKDGVIALSVDPGGSSGPGAGSEIVSIAAQSNGGAVFDAAGKPTFTDPAVVDALEYFVDLGNAGALATGTNYPGQQALGAEKGAFDLSTVASYQYNLKAVDGKFDMGVAPLPSGSDHAANALNGTNIALFQDATPQEQEAAWRYMEFLASPGEMAQWAAATGYLPISKAATEDPHYQDYVAANPWVTDVVAQLDEATRPVPREWTTQAQGLFAVAVGEALEGVSSPADALAKAQDAAGQLVQ